MRLIKNHIVRKISRKTIIISFTDNNHAKFDSDSKKEC